MNSLQIKYFFELVRCESFSKAAEELYISQPAVSKCISSLEDELGVQLFHRSYRKATLTMAGKRYYDFFRQVEDSYLELRSSLIPEQAGKREIRIGIIEEMRMPKLNRVIREFGKQDDSIRFSFSHESVGDIYGQFKNNKYDLIILLELIPGVTDKYHNAVLDSVPMGLYYRKQNFDASDIRNFENEVYVYVRHMQSHDETFSITLQKSLWDLLGFEPKIQRAVDSFSSLQMAVECGVGYAIMATCHPIHYAEDISCMELDITSNLWLMWKDETLSPIVERFLQLYREEKF